MQRLRFLLLSLLVPLAGCGQAGPDISGVWTDTEDRVFIEFVKEEFYVGEKKAQIRVPCGTFKWVDGETIEIAFTIMGNKARSYAKNPKKNAAIIQDALISQSEQSKLEDTVQLKVRLEGDKLSVQPQGKSAVAFIKGK